MNVADRLPLVIVGHGGEEHVGSHLLHAAAELGVRAEFADVRRADGGPVMQRLSWRVRDHRPARFERFNREVRELCGRFRPGLLLATGIAPLSSESLAEIGALGTRRVNLLTDDPFNPAHRTRWFIEALMQYDEVLSTRRANMGELGRAGCRKVGYAPFAYAPHLHFEPALGEERRRELESDVIFAGGADSDRVPYIAALDRAGLRVGLYGGYWDRYPETRELTRGLQPPGMVREAIAAAKIALCLVRRANRDGTCMRTFEAPAIGAAMLVEKTDEHVELFGPDRTNVVYFDTIDEMVARAGELARDENERNRLRRAAQRLITSGGHSYRDRLASILDGKPASVVSAAQ